ncbi:interactor of HORMAD1 protein 1 [Nothobranchius furzeri]|uniref:Transcript variant X1 n=2 Tax=Nothobranchius furzeri TaxID=105023 RepID=A0A9D2XSU8_NOTFU|nr:transcript variant X1 [Nothobranchius furzeri]KAF7207841.1 transcript variant X2 [Nothobranchius furzeri]
MKHIRNIKEMLNIPNGNRNATSGHSTLPDSQHLFGSQFWTDSSQSNSQDVNFSSRNSQRSSQEGSEPKVYSRYVSKPLLFGDKCRTSGLLEKYEEDIKKAKEKSDRDLFAREFQNIRDTLISIQQLVSGTERNTASFQALFKKLDIFASASECLQRDLSQKFDSLVDKLSSHKAVMTELEDGMQKHVDTTAELQSQLLTLTTSLESLREEHKGQKQLLEEALKLLNSLVSKPSAKPSPDQWLDSAVQTTPGLQQSVSNNLKKTQPTSANVKQPPVETSLQVHRHGFRKKSYPLRSNTRKKKSPMPLQISKTSVSKKNCQHGKQCSKPLNMSEPLRERCDENTVFIEESSSDGVMPVSKGNRFSVTAGCFISPLSDWSQDSGNSDYVNIIEPILGKLSAESMMATPKKPGNLWDLFDSDYDV